MIVSNGSHLLYATWMIFMPRDKCFTPLWFCLASCYIAEFLTLGQLPYTWLFIPISLCFGFALILIPKRPNFLLRSALTITCIVLTTVEIVSVKPACLDITTRETIPFGYRIGDTANNVASATSIEGSRIVRSLLHGDLPDSKPGSIVLIEHDQWESYSDIAAVGNWHQAEPWNENQLQGNQFWLAAIFRDGQFQSNLGGQAKADGQVKLLASSQLGENTCLAVEKNGVLYLGDADYLSNGMAAYQAALIKEILGTPSQFVNIRLTSILLLLGSIGLDLSYILFKRKIQFITICVVGAAFLCTPTKGLGDVRIVGNIYDAHETSRASGALSALSDAGISAIRGDFGAKVLIVAEGLTAIYKKELLILLEPGASVKIGADVYSANNIPLGIVNEIVDARTLTVNDFESEKVDIVFNGVRIVGTGSPSKNVAQLWPRR